MIVRCYAATYGDGIDGLMLCGTPGVFKTAAPLISTLKKLIDEGKGEESAADYEEKLMGWMWTSKRYEENPITSRSEWVCSDPEVIADHLGNYGEGVYAVSNWLTETWHMVRTKIYPGYRHEILNYLDIRDEVEDGIIEFVKCIIQIDNLEY